VHSHLQTFHTGKECATNVLSHTDHMCAVCMCSDCLPHSLTQPLFWPHDKEVCVCEKERRREQNLPIVCQRPVKTHHSPIWWAVSMCSPSPARLCPCRSISSQLVFNPILYYVLFPLPSSHSSPETRAQIKSKFVTCAEYNRPDSETLTYRS
jgi:hypothetical protein